MKEIALALGPDISSYIAMAKTKRQLSKTLRASQSPGARSYEELAREVLA